MKNVEFRGIPLQKDEFCGHFRDSNSAAKTQIPRLSSKFRGPRKTVGPTHYSCGQKPELVANKQKDQF